ATELDELLLKVPVASRDERLELLREMIAIPDARVDSILEYLSSGALYIDRRDERLVQAVREGSGYQVRSLFSEDTDASVQQRKRREVRRWTVNNQQRRELRRLRAQTLLLDPRPAIRGGAIEFLLDVGDTESITALRQLAETEPQRGLRKQIRVALALNDLRVGSAPEVTAALARMRGESSQIARAAFRVASEREELPDALRAQASAQLAHAQTRVRWMQRIEAVFFGLSLGSVLLLASIGLAITFGVMGVINMAHGELIMLGAYTTWVLQQVVPSDPGVALVLAIPAAFLVSGTVGLLIERVVIRRLYGRPLETLLATFGISLILQQAVRSVFSPLNRSVATPSWLQGAWEVAPGLTLTYNRLAIVAFSLLVFAGLLLLLKHTRFGLQVRAVSQNREMARALGIASSRVDALTFALGAGIAGIAGVALSQLTNVGPNLGQAYIIDSFLVVVFGGVGNLWGTLSAAFTLGLGSKILEPMVGAVLAKIITLLALIVFLQRRPEGLFSIQGRRS
ncbi:MAG: urea ABC transporter permease subunit UrtB, partial [Pseudomonadota bacterium]